MARKAQSSTPAESLAGELGFAEHTGLVKSLANKYAQRHTGIDLDDLIQEGWLGVLHAASTFDKTLKCKFETHATWCIRSRLSNFVISCRRRKLLEVWRDDAADANEAAQENTEQQLDYESALRDLLKPIPFILRYILIHKDGLFGESPQTFPELAADMQLKWPYVAAAYAEARRLLALAAKRSRRTK